MSSVSVALSVVVGSLGTLTGALAGFEWWQLLIVMSIYILLQFAVEVSLRILEKKKIISPKEREEIKDSINDSVKDIVEDLKEEDNDTRRNGSKD